MTLFKATPRSWKYQLPIRALAVTLIVALLAFIIADTFCNTIDRLTAAIAHFIANTL